MRVWIFVSIHVWLLVKWGCMVRCCMMWCFMMWCCVVWRWVVRSCVVWCCVVRCCVIRLFEKVSHEWMNLIMSVCVYIVVSKGCFVMRTTKIGVVVVSWVAFMPKAVSKAFVSISEVMSKSV